MWVKKKKKVVVDGGGQRHVEVGGRWRWVVEVDVGGDEGGRQLAYGSFKHVIDKSDKGEGRGERQPKAGFQCKKTTMEAEVYNESLEMISEEEDVLEMTRGHPLWGLVCIRYRALPPWHTIEDTRQGNRHPTADFNDESWYEIGMNVDGLVSQFEGMRNTGLWASPIKDWAAPQSSQRDKDCENPPPKKPENTTNGSPLLLLPPPITSLHHRHPPLCRHISTVLPPYQKIQIHIHSFIIKQPPESDGSQPPKLTDEWGEKSERETEPLTKLATSDPPIQEDEWGAGAPDQSNRFSGNGSPAVESNGIEDGGKIEELKRCLVDSVYGTGLGFRASSEERAEVIELVARLEAANPTPAPTDAVDLLDGNWILLYTAFSELVPLLAVGSTPLLKVDKISQEIFTSSLTIDNSITFSTPFATFTSTASANFEVRSPSRIQVQFKEGSFEPPNIKSNVSLPQNVEIFGQNISLSPVQQPLDALQEAVANLAGAISGQPPLKVPIPGERTKSWLLITFLDKDLRISRGDGGLFVLAKEGSGYNSFISTKTLRNRNFPTTRKKEMSGDQQTLKLDDEQLTELREIFRSFDRNKDGSLTQLELGSLLRSLGLTPSPDQLESLIQKADTNSNGLVEFSEDGNGYITAAELAHSMAKLGHALTAEELTGMIKEADTDGDGRINFQEFSRAITSAAFDNSFS
ncbi:hypothetical protein OSB04_022141 [Centaurea solstitialis]|uniref:EF-hand domain-containing protein n=1 Tax=Centaurea solstitialis TaxID=347529 RepID=A0AA38SVT2_9ASTR|nr:hypothetical protein OSB04_022141 [Centaurea solstitialis]